ncbi:hypothetical protein DFJ74DRAFT_687424 [Hyaloraphidium curvatum]|nr:hypothetical protein DFJ74DRAFT_687424 [Hyaloraphidium curvatum]
MSTASEDKKRMQRRQSAHGFRPPELHGAAKIYVPVVFWTRLVLTMLVVAILFVVVMLLSFVLRILGLERYSNYIAGRIIAFAVTVIGGIRYKIIGAEYLDATRPCVFVSNHQSSLDMITMARVFPMSCFVIAKKELARLPFLGWYFTAAGNFALDRKNHAAAIDMMGQVAERMKERKMGVWIYPEGTRSYLRKADLLDFKKGGFRTAIDCQCPVVPVVFSVYTHVFDEKAKRWPGGTITVRVLPPIPTKGLTAADTQQLLDTTRDTMLHTLKQISGARFRDTITDLDVPEVDLDDETEVPEGEKKDE